MKFSPGLLLAGVVVALLFNILLGGLLMLAAGVAYMIEVSRDQ